MSCRAFVTTEPDQALSVDARVTWGGQARPRPPAAAALGEALNGLCVDSFLWSYPSATVVFHYKDLGFEVLIAETHKNLIGYSTK